MKQSIKGFFFKITSNPVGIYIYSIVPVAGARENGFGTYITVYAPQRMYCIAAT
jgi:hypothetical protein